VILHARLGKPERIDRAPDDDKLAEGGDDYMVGVSGPIVAIIVGAILRFAVNVESWWWAAHGWWISVPTLGDILLIGGAAWLAMVLALEGSRRAQVRRREFEQRQHEDADWQHARELERARSVMRMTMRGAGGRRRRDDDDDY
jgi:hypothetical protein